IGAGAIVRKGDMVLGVTTAATLWFATVVGLCLGGGQLVLGAVAGVLGYVVLTAVRVLERRIERYQSGTLILVAGENTFVADALRLRLQGARFRVKSISVTYSPAEQRQRIACEVRWPSVHGAAELPSILGELERTPGLIRLAWQTTGTGPN
ncbi:MAG: MgtC/SapB family protein, partial [Terracidiphilus sp.]